MCQGLKMSHTTIHFSVADLCFRSLRCGSTNEDKHFFLLLILVYSTLFFKAIQA